MGSKNRIFLGILSWIILHHLRNTFSKTELYVTKHKKNKIKHKHPEEYRQLHHDFQKIIDRSVGYCDYSKEEHVYNFLSFCNEQYYLFSISTNNHHLELGTFFIASKKQLKKCQRENNLKFFGKKFEEELERYLS